MWIWQQADWPHFKWNENEISPLLRQLHFNQGLLLGNYGSLVTDSQQVTLDTLLANIIHSSAIEGEKLNAHSVRSSLARKLGMKEDQQYPTSEETDGLAEMMTDAISQLDQTLSIERILRWHRWLFPSGTASLNPIDAGKLRGTTPMQVVSGRIDKPKIHFEAPPRATLDAELQYFIDWFNKSRKNVSLDPFIRAAICHLWFVTLHPLDDGNGRITRLLTDLALAQAENQSIRLYAMSVTILADKKSYYEILETTQKGDIDITPWLLWFLDKLNQTLKNALADIQQTMAKTRYWQRVDQSQLMKEQVKVLNRLLDGEFELGINASQYQKVAKVSRATATRHLSQLVAMSCLKKSESGGRSTRYSINFFV